MTEEKKKKKSVTEELVSRLEKDRDRLIPKTYASPRPDTAFDHIDDSYIYNVPPTPIFSAKDEIGVELYNPESVKEEVVGDFVEIKPEDAMPTHLPVVGHYASHEMIKPTETETYKYSSKEYMKMMDMLIKSNKKIEDLEKAVNSRAGSDEISSKSATEKLKAIVDDFNKSLKTWYQMTGCVVNFGWKYDPSGCKMLDISSIDYIVYRKPAPSEESLKSVLKNGTP